jgi:hypothetical protein
MMPLDPEPARLGFAPAGPHHRGDERHAHHDHFIGVRGKKQCRLSVREEIVNLQIRLDTLDRREAIRKKLDERITGPEK